MFNTGGYNLWFSFKLQQADKQIEAILDKEMHKDKDLITIRFPLSLPYQNDTKEFERISGEVNFNGKIYKYVKRKIENGEFVLLCLADKNKMQIEKSKVDFFSATNDLNQSSSNKSDDSKTIAFKKFSSEYYQDCISFIINPPGNHSEKFKMYKSGDLISSVHISTEQPPDLFPA